MKGMYNMIREVKDNTLYFDGCSTVELAKKYGTPLYVFSETAIHREFEELNATFVSKYPNTRVAYASKAFCTVAMYRLCQANNACIDVVSGGELYTAMQAGYPAEKIEFNGNNKQPEEIAMALDYGIGRFIVDGLQELTLLEAMCAERGKTANVLFRITPGVKSDSHDYIVTGKKDSKFGIPLDDDVIYPQVKQAIDAAHINFMGFHFHVGSQLFDNGSHLQALDIMLNVVKTVKERFHYDVTELNLGGGFGAVYTTEDRKPYAYFLDPMMERIEAFFKEMGINRPNVVIELPKQDYPYTPLAILRRSATCANMLLSTAAWAIISALLFIRPSTMAFWQIKRMCQRMMSPLSAASAANLAISSFATWPWPQQNRATCWQFSPPELMAIPWLPTIIAIAFLLSYS